MIAIDTSVAVNFLRGDEKAVMAVEAALKGSDAVGISTVSIFEMLHPIYHRKMARHERHVRGFFRQLRVLPLDTAGAEAAAKIMGGLLRAGKAVNALDVLIAGTAAANVAEKVVSSDRDFLEIAKVSDLEVEIISASPT
jgi:predicted nucleic acid-binding protein